MTRRLPGVYRWMEVAMSMVFNRKWKWWYIFWTVVAVVILTKKIAEMKFDHTERMAAIAASQRAEDER